MLLENFNLKSRWKVKDLIDLEYFFLNDKNADFEENSRLNHSIYKSISEETGNKKLKRRDLIKIYLDKRKSKEKSESDLEFFPGEMFSEGYRIFLFIIIAIAVCSGMGLTFSILKYDGVTPVNISHYFGFIVLFQVAIVVLFFLFLLFRRFFYYKKRGFITLIFSAFLSKIVIFLAQNGLGHLSKEKRNIFEQILGKTKSWNIIYGSIFSYMVFIAVQIFGIAFNFGVIAGTLIKVTFTDIAFGWQSTLLSSSSEIHSIVEKIALPWSWFIPGNIAFPSIEQIDGSKMILKEGIKTLSNTDLSSWWPFLLMSVIVYGLFPRIVFLSTALCLKKWKLSSLSFNQTSCDRLIRQMESRLVETKGISDLNNEKKDICYGDENIHKTNFVGDGEKASIFIPFEISTLCNKNELQPYISDIFGFSIDEIIVLNQDFDEDMEIINKLKNSNELVFIVEAWQPPINETIFFFQQLRKNLGKERRIGIGLIGKPDNDEFITKVTNHEYGMWLNAIEAMGDPYLRIEKLR